MRNTGSENAAQNAAHKADVKARRLAASRPERHAAMQKSRRAI